MICSIIIPHHDRKDHLQKLLNKITCPEYEIIISSGGTFAENCNRGAKKATSNYLIFCNDDCLPSIENIKEIVEVLNYCDIVGSTQITRNGQKYYGVGVKKCKEKPLYRPYIMLEENKSIFPSGFCFGIRKSQYEILGGFDENFKTGYEDVDFGIRCIDNNFRIAMLDLEIYHAESQSDGRFKHESDNANYLLKKQDQQVFKSLYENINYCI